MIKLEMIYILILFIVVVVWIVRMKSYAKSNYENTLDNIYQSQPLSIHLVEDLSPKWLEKKKIASTVATILSLGFDKDKSYKITEKPHLVIQHFYKDHVQCMLYKHTSAGFWVEFAVESTDDKLYFVSNTHFGGKLDSPPDVIKYVDSSMSINELYKKIADIQQTVDTKHLLAEQFKKMIETAYKKDLDWRYEKGGLTYEEFLKEVLVGEGERASEQTLLIYSKFKEQQVHDWHNLAIKHYVNGSNTDIDDLDKFSNEVLIVPHKTYAPSFINYLHNVKYINEDQCKKLKIAYKDETDMFKLFDEISEMLSPDMRAHFLTEQDIPLKLKVYALPNFTV